MKLLHELGDEATGPGGVTRASFGAGALREISVGLVREKFYLLSGIRLMLARSSSASFRPGLAWPCPLMLLWSSCAVCLGSLLLDAVLLVLSSCLC
jgi:hypothetical protein